jgi:hypothetical protein
MGISIEKLMDYQHKLELERSSHMKLERIESGYQQ